MKILGDYKELNSKASLPSLRDFCQDTQYEYQKEIIQYLRNGHKDACSPGIVKDYFTGEIIEGELFCMSDGMYGWRSDIVYYVEKYNLRLPDDFIDHVLKKLGKK